MSKNEKITVLLYHAKGEESEVEINPDNLLNNLQMLVGGYIQIAATSEEHYLLADEDGLLKERPVNQHYPYLVGNVVLIKKEHLK